MTTLSSALVLPAAPLRRAFLKTPHAACCWSRPALESPVLWPCNFGTGVDWAYRTIQQARAAGRIIDWPRGKVIGGSGSINAMIWVWGAAPDFDQWAYAGCHGWDYARFQSVFQSIETCARKTSNSDRGTITSGNTNAPTIVIAEQAAQMIWGTKQRRV